MDGTQVCLYPLRKAFGKENGMDYCVAKCFIHQVWRLVSLLLSFNGGELNHVTTSNCKGNWEMWSGLVPMNKRTRVW